MVENMEDIVWYGDYIPLPTFLAGCTQTFASLGDLAGGYPAAPDRAVEDIGQALKEKVLSSFAVKPSRIISEDLYVRKDHVCPATGREMTGSIAWRAHFEWDQECPGLHLNPFKLDGK
jgi:hypothetical protein